MKTLIDKLFEWLGYVPKFDFNKIDFDQKYRCFKLDGITRIDLVNELGNTVRIPSELLQGLGYEYAILCAEEICEMLNKKI